MLQSSVKAYIVIWMHRTGKPYEIHWDVRVFYGCLFRKYIVCITI